MTQLLDMRFRSRVMNYRIAFGCYCCHDGVLCRCYTGFIHQEICAAQAIGLKCKTALIFHIYAECTQGKDMCIKATAANHISAGRRQFELTNACCHGACDQNGGANAAAKVRVQICGLKVTRGDSPRSGIQLFNLCTQAFDQVAHDAYILDLWYISQYDRLIRKQTGGQKWKRSVFVPCGSHFSV